MEKGKNFSSPSPFFEVSDVHPILGNFWFQPEERKDQHRDHSVLRETEIELQKPSMRPLTPYPRRGGVITPPPFGKSKIF